jgi:hypothetical protein
VRFTVATHGHCFDGLSSAVVFTRLIQELEGRGYDFDYRACGYTPDQPPLAQVLDGAQNAILDYRFCPSDKLTWYFDHHLTAFNSQHERDYFEARKDSGRFFFDPTVSSCTKYIAQVARQTFGLDMAELAPLESWADVVDSARFDSAEAAIDRSHPVLRLVNVIENHCDSEFLASFVPRLLREPLDQVAKSPAIEALYAPLGAKAKAFESGVRRLAEVEDNVVFVDMTSMVVDSIGKFVAYALHPTIAYSVVVVRLPGCIKISVGHNPWSGHELNADISAICARYGGGGHPMVGGITFQLGELDRAVEVGRIVARELNGQPPNDAAAVG